MVLKFFLHDYIKINLTMDNKDGNFNSIPFQCKKVDGIINVLLTEKIRKDWFPLIVNYSFIDSLSPGGTFYSL